MEVAADVILKKMKGFFVAVIVDERDLKVKVALMPTPARQGHSNRTNNRTSSSGLITEAALLCSEVPAQSLMEASRNALNCSKNLHWECVQAFLLFCFLLWFLSSQLTYGACGLSFSFSFLFFYSFSNYQLGIPRGGGIKALVWRQQMVNYVTFMMSLPNHCYNIPIICFNTCLHTFSRIAQ